MEATGSRAWTASSVATGQTITRSIASPVAAVHSVASVASSSKTESISYLVDILEN